MAMENEHKEPPISSSEALDWGTSQEEIQQMEEDIQLSQNGAVMENGGYEKEKPTQTTHRESAATVRQSDILKSQSSYGMKIADKASHLQEKKNLEGTHYDSQNSFAVLNNHELIARADKMGINTDFMNSKSCDLLRDLERAQANLKIENK